MIPARNTVAALLVIFALLGCASVSMAAELRTADVVDIAPGEVIREDVYLFGNRITVRGTVDGDVVTAGRTVIIDGTVTGSVWAAGEALRLDGTVGRSVRLAGRDVQVGARVGGDLLSAGSEVRFAGSVDGDMWTASDLVRLSGPISGDLLGSAGNLVISGPIGGNVEVSAGSLRLTQGADIGGRLRYISDDRATIDPGASISGGLIHVPTTPKARVSPLRAEKGRIVYVLGLVLSGALATWLLPGGVKGIGSKMRKRPWPALGLGFIGLVVTPVAAIILGITLVGLPIALILTFLYALTIYLSPIFAGYVLGDGLFQRLNQGGHAVVATILGILILWLIGRIPVVGSLLNLAVVILGIGAMLMWLSSRRGSEPREIEGGGSPESSNRE